MSLFSLRKIFKIPLRHFNDFYTIFQQVVSEITHDYAIYINYVILEYYLMYGFILERWHSRVSICCYHGICMMHVIILIYAIIISMFNFAEFMVP